MYVIILAKIKKILFSINQSIIAENFMQKSSF